jgi:glycolate oxidase FAD binding subunit
MPTSLVSEVSAEDDLTDALAEQVRIAAANRTPLRIVGGDTKAFYGRAIAGEPLDLAGHRGIIACEPTELVLTARAGTPLGEIEDRLAQHGQRLGFEPPHFGPASTIGGVVAAGLAGARRPFAGAVRDFVLGATVLDGRGEVLKFGGQVFKNVAGFDAFRLMAGALGGLGVILDVSLRVAPMPQREIGLALEMNSEAARQWLTRTLGGATPISGAFHDGEQLHLRLSGGAAGVDGLARELGGRDEALSFWENLQAFRHPAFDDDGPLWRVTLPQTAGPFALGETIAWDWAGALRWVRSDAEPAAIWRAAAEAHGHATLWRGAAPGDDVFQPLPAPLLALHQRLKAAFDPAGVLNPGRMYGAL